VIPSETILLQCGLAATVGRDGGWVNPIALESAS